MRKAFLLFLLIFVGCDEPTSTPPADGTYTVRGRLAGVIGSEVSIQHEAIPDFRNRSGERVGMETMTMSFHRPETLSLDGIEANDPVEFTFEVRWEGAPPMTLTAIRALADDTPLQL